MHGCCEVRIWTRRTGGADMQQRLRGAGTRNADCEPGPESHAEPPVSGARMN